jgi:hypothetical protein
MFRRAFLKTASVISGGVMLPVYSEPLIQFSEYRNWVQDKGDYYIVNVPERKVFGNENLDKPTIFLLGVSSSVVNVSITGFTNIRGSKGVAIRNFYVDTRNCRSDTNRASIILQNFMTSVVENVRVEAPPDQMTGISMFHLNA